MRIIQVKQGSPGWQEARLEKISGTRLCSAIGTPAKQESLLNELIAERLTREAKESYISLPMAKGIEGEDYAVIEYEQKTGNLTEMVGICVHDDYDWLINSPDRLIPEKGKYLRAAEIKCPNNDTQVKYVRAGELPSDYQPQVMSYFLVNKDLQELDFVSFCPRMQTEQYRLFIKTVKRSDLPLGEAMEKVLKFYDKWQEELRRLNLAL